VSLGPDPGSFRDPLSTVFVGPEGVYRGLTEPGLREFEAVAGAGFFDDLVGRGRIVRTERVAPDEAPLAGEWAAVLRHERVPVITYPYEWSFAMLRDAALLQLEVTERAVADGFTTKDASSYNVQFRGADPVFIDVGSFERLRPGEPWPGYRQFCELFLNPLVAQGVAGIPFQPWLRGSVDGISPADAASLVRGWRRLDRRLLVHVRLHARAERRYADSDRDVRDELRHAGLGPKVLAAQLANLRDAVERLRWDDARSEWSDYTDRAHYTDIDLAAKESFVARAVEADRPSTVLDLGANDGRFSVLAVDHGARLAIAADSDHLVVDRLYRRLRDAGDTRVLPLVIDLADPPPGLGWRSRERRPWAERMQPDLVLALALVHHLALTDTVPFGEIVAFLADFDAPLIVELPHRDDPMVERLLGRKRAGLFDHYTTDGWERALAERFHVAEREVLPSGRRTLYRCRRR
jgi:hypothetical protein